MNFRMRPFVGAVIVLGMLLALLSPMVGHAEVVTYEDWQDGVIHSDQWQGSESFGGQEIVREVTPDHRLELRYRRQGSTASNTGGAGSGQSLSVNLAKTPDLLGVQATFTVTDLDMTTCPANNVAAATRARPARLLMGAFNDGSSSGPGDRLGDHIAVVQAFRDGSTSNASTIMNVQAVISRCTNASCSTNVTVVFNTLAATVSVGQTFTLRLRWDQANHRFVFGLDDGADVPVLYGNVSDVDPAISEFVNVEVNHTVANCTAGPAAVDSTTLVGPVSVILPDPIFGDVPRSNPLFPWIEALAEAGITGGCSTNPPQYCPDTVVTRGQMAVFLLRGIHGAGYDPPAATGTVFADVPASHPLAKWIEQLAAEGITGGCATSPARYCPDATVTRAQMAVFLLRAKHGAAYDPPAPTGTVFADVPASHPLAKWIEQLAAEGITGGCATSPARYCPDATVTRAQMAVFLVRAFNLPL